MTIYVEAQFTLAGAAATGLSPTVTIYQLSDNSVVVNAQAMSEVGGGFYKRDVTAALTATVDYAGFVNAGTDSVDTRIKPLFFGAFAEVNSVLADTNELQTDLVNGGRLDLLIDGIKAKTDNIPASPATEAKQDTIIGYIDTEVAAIKAKTDNLPASPAAVGSAMTLADDAITASKFDETTAFPLKAADTGSTAVARTGADADTLETLSDQLDAIPTSNPSAATIADAVWDEAIADHSASGTFGAKNQKVVPSETIGDYKADISALATSAEIAALNDVSAADVRAEIDSNSTQLAAIIGYVDDLETRLTADRAGYLDKLNVSGTLAHTDNASSFQADISALAIEANVQGHAADALTAYDPPSKAEMDSAQSAIQGDIAALNDITVADILAGVIEGTLSLQQTLRVCLAALAGKSTGGGTGSVAFRSFADDSDRIAATVDENGNRTAITLDGS